MTEDVTLEEAQSYIDGITVARIITDWSTTIGKGYGRETQHALSAVGPIQGMIGLAVKNKHLYVIDDQELLDSRDPEHPSYGATEKILRRRYDERLTINREVEIELSRKLDQANNLIFRYRLFIAIAFIFSFLSLMFGVWSFN